MTDFCRIPLASLRENSVMELNLEGKGIGVPGAIVLSELLPSAAALTSLKCVATPGSPRMSDPAEHLHLPRSLDGNMLTASGRDMSGVIKLAEVLPQIKLQSLR